MRNSKNGYGILQIRHSVNSQQYYEILQIAHAGGLKIWFLSPCKEDLDKNNCNIQHWDYGTVVDSAEFGAISKNEKLHSMLNRWTNDNLHSFE